jgi:hypothetical protein
VSRKVKVVEIAESTTAGVRRHLFDLVTHLDRDRFSVSVIASTLRDRGFFTDIGALNRKGRRVATALCLCPRTRPFHV